MKLRHQIDDDAYNREYQRICRELDNLRIEKDEAVKANLSKTKDIGKMTAIKEIIGDGTKPLKNFDEALFDAIVDKVVVIVG